MQPAILSTVLDALLPRTCLLCGARSTESVCQACAADLPLHDGLRCPLCGEALAVAAPACGACLRSRPAFDATHAALRYSFPVDRLLLALKFNRRLAVAEFASTCMRAHPPSEGTLMMPVPLSAARLRERGFNQALEIARPLARALHLPLDTTSLRRTRETPPQSRLPWRARQANVRHAFACTRDLGGAAVIVVDDIMTTGATLDAIARALKDQGAQRVVNWVTARALKTIT